MRWYCPDCGVQVTRFDYVDAAADRWSHCLGCREYKFFKPVPSELEWKRAEDLRMVKLKEMEAGLMLAAMAIAADAGNEAASAGLPGGMGLPEWVAAMREKLKD